MGVNGKGKEPTDPSGCIDRIPRTFSRKSGLGDRFLRNPQGFRLVGRKWECPVKSHPLGILVKSVQNQRKRFFSQVLSVKGFRSFEGQDFAKLGARFVPVERNSEHFSKCFVLYFYDFPPPRGLIMA
jgi:hypothetical protein